MADHPSGLVLIAAPTGRDAILAADVLGKAGVPTCTCPTLGALAAAITSDVGAVLLAEEALSSADIDLFLNALRAQEPWSDLPILLLTHAQTARDHTAVAVAQLRPATFVTLLERPFRAATLVSGVEAALRARQRQWQVRDLIEERKAAERALAESAERLRAATDAAKLGTWDYFPLTGELIWNDHCRAQFDLPPGEPVNYEVFLAGLHPDDRVRADAAVIQALDPRGTGHINIEFRTIGFTDCVERWLISTGRAKFEFGRAVRFTGTTVDITERKLAEELIRASREQLRLVIDNAAALVVYCDYERRYRFANRQYAERLGLHPSQVIGRTIEEVVGPAAYHAFEQYVEEVLAGRTVEFEAKIPYENLGSRWMHCAYVPDKDERGEVRGFVALIRDVQERREEEEALREAKSQAEAANAAKDHFLATLSHELRTPLTPVLMALADHVSNPALPPELREDLAMIRRNVELEARLIDDLLDLTRVSRGKIELHAETVDVHRVLQEALEVCTANDTVRRQITVEFEPDATVHHAQADRARLQQVFWNLINNALKFSPNDSRVIIRTSNPSPGRIAVEVRDHGFGIEADKLSRLFDAFEQGGRAITKRFGGLGLGLAISKALVELHNGTIRAHSEGRNKGASFIVELDTCTPAPSISQQTSADGSNAARPLQVLLVEDHETTLAVLTRLLRRAGHEVTPASRVAEARERLAEKHFDLLISDLGLPDGTGTDLVRDLDSHAMPSIALSGYGMDADVRECLEAGFHSHVTKPVDWQRLSATIQQLTAGER
jgi:PAS domain S-box-containing protein